MQHRWNEEREERDLARRSRSRDRRLRGDGAPEPDPLQEDEVGIGNDNPQLVIVRSATAVRAYPIEYIERDSEIAELHWSMDASLEEVSALLCSSKMGRIFEDGSR